MRPTTDRFPDLGIILAHEMSMKYLLVAFILPLSMWGSAQSDSTADWRVFKRSDQVRRIASARDTSRNAMLQRTPGQITINEGPRIKELAAKYDRMKHIQKGYRVQIYLGDRKGQGEARKKFNELFPDYASYPDYQAPNFKVRVGDFKHRADAERLLYEVRKEFPGAFIVPDEVELLRIP